MVMMQPPPGMAELLASLGLQNPAILASMLAAKGVQPPPVPSTTAPMAGSQVAAAAAPTPAPPPATNPGPPSFSPPAPPHTPTPPSGYAPAEPAPTTGPTDYASLAARVSGASGIMTPTAAEGQGGGVRYPPQAPQPPGALASQMPDILKLLMAGGAPQPLPSLGSLILGH